MPKTLVFSFDGTGNEPRDVSKFQEDESITNILKLHILMGGGMKPSTTTLPNSDGTQMTHYYNGVGTRAGGRSMPLVGKLRDLINMAVAPSFGDARRILEEAHQDFDDAQYDAETDKIVVFGFSRGAALARKFVSELLDGNDDARVAFLGVYDTVAAMDGIHRRGERISTDVLFEDGTLHSNVDSAVHLLALDEERVPFSPTLINRDDKKPDRILEVWMPGVHSDVGGGYWMDGLADVSLEFMINRCRGALEKNIDIADGSDGKKIRQLLSAQGRELGCVTADDVIIRPVETGILHPNTEGVLAHAGGLEPRTVRVNRNDRPIRKPKRKETPLVHQAVKARFHGVPGYRPVPLRGIPYRLFSGEQGGNVRQGITDLRLA